MAADQYFDDKGMPICIPGQNTYGPPDSEGIRWPICNESKALYNSKGVFIGDDGAYIPPPQFPVFITPFGQVRHPEGPVTVSEQDMGTLTLFLDSVLNPGWIGHPGYLASIGAIGNAWYGLSPMAQYSAVNVLTQWLAAHAGYDIWWWTKPTAAETVHKAAPHHARPTA